MTLMLATATITDKRLRAVVQDVGDYILYGGHFYKDVDWANDHKELKDMLSEDTQALLNDAFDGANTLAIACFYKGLTEELVRIEHIRQYVGVTWIALLAYNKRFVDGLVFQWQTPISI